MITTRNRELCHYSTKDADAKVTGMDHKDGTNLLMHLAQVEERNENKTLAETIVKVFSLIVVSLDIFIKLKHNTGTPLLCFGYCPSWCLHSHSL